MRRLIPLFFVVLALVLVGAGCATPIPSPTEPPLPTDTPSSQVGGTWTRDADDMVMVYVPEGEFEMGSDDGEPWEQPAHTVALDGFRIDRTEVTNAQYQRCEEAGVCDPPRKTATEGRPFYYGDSIYDAYPVVWVNWHQATDYCSWAGARLPMEAEWEYAARGPEGHLFPWGDEFDGDRLNYCDVNCPHYLVVADMTVDDGYGPTAPVGSYPEGASWCGALDMAGNVDEWVADWFGKYPSELQVNPAGPSSGTLGILRGGAYWRSSFDVRAARRGTYEHDDEEEHIGFRCAKDAD